jgi:hypothetical protein
MIATAAFDRIAAAYDAQWTDTPAGRPQRGEHADQSLRSAKEAEAALTREGLAAAYDEVEA